MKTRSTATAAYDSNNTSIVAGYYNHSKNMQKDKLTYEPPKVMAFEVQTDSVLCGSVDSNWESGFKEIDE